MASRPGALRGWVYGSAHHSDLRVQHLVDADEVSPHLVPERMFQRELQVVQSVQTVLQRCRDLVAFPSGKGLELFRCFVRLDVCHLHTAANSSRLCREHLQHCLLQALLAALRILGGSLHCVRDGRT